MPSNEQAMSRKPDLTRQDMTDLSAAITLIAGVVVRLGYGRASVHCVDLAHDLVERTVGPCVALKVWTDTGGERIE
jgi:hypothetical protein